MDGRIAALKEKLDRLLREAAEVSVSLDRANGTVVGVPHYSVIELQAHELGRRLSQEIQQRHMSEVAAQRIPQAACPACGTRCDLAPRKRAVTSIDGPVEIQELLGHCPCCRRAFFPRQTDLGTGRP